DLRRTRLPAPVRGGYHRPGFKGEEGLQLRGVRRISVAAVLVTHCARQCSPRSDPANRSGRSMATQNVSHLLGTLQRDPESEDALRSLAARAPNGAPDEPALDEDALRLLDRAREGHDARAEYRAAAE